MSALPEFLLARIAEDEAVARAAIANGEGALDWADAGDPTDVHIARWDPARVLAECEAKRRIVEHHRPARGDDEFPLCSICTEVGPEAQGWPCLTLRLLALPYADHPDYDERWRP